MPRISVEESQPAPVVPSSKPDSAPTSARAGQNSPVDDELRANSHGKLPAFCAFPADTTFQGEEEDETIILLLRQHPILIVRWVVTSILALFVPIIIFPLVFTSGLLPPVPIGFRLVLSLFWFLGTATYALLNFLSWYFNVYIVTNERVVDTDWYSIIYRKVSSAQISRIQDVSSVQSGVLAGVFDYGTVTIETAGELPNFDFASVPHPQLIVKKLQEMIEKEEKEFENHLPGE